MGLWFGVDDYVIKFFNLFEVIVWVEVVFCRIRLVVEFIYLWFLRMFFLMIYFDEFYVEIIV